MARKIAKFAIAKHMTTHEGALAHDLSQSDALQNLVFTFGSALFVDGFYQTQTDELARFWQSLRQVWRQDPKFAWQYGAWMRDARRGKGNRIQGTLVPALLDAMSGGDAWTERYVAMCLSHRADDVIAFKSHYTALALPTMSQAARRGLAKALCTFDEYALMKYAAQKDDLRLCDVIAFVRPQLLAFGDEARLALAVGDYLHASSRDRIADPGVMPLTSARRALWAKPASFALSSDFGHAVAAARVTWEQVMGHFGGPGAKKALRRQRVWMSVLQTQGLVGDLALLRNLRNFADDDVPRGMVMREAQRRAFAEVWPHQVAAAYRHLGAQQRSVADAIFERMVDRLPQGRHLGIADASGSMSVKVGGVKGSTTALDVALCLTGLMSQTSGWGASFSDDSMLNWSGGEYLSLVKRARDESALAFSQRAELRRGWGGTQVFGALMSLIVQLEKERITPPDCLWFFSDMQFHPAGGAVKRIPPQLQCVAQECGGTDLPPLELAIAIYRRVFNVDVDVVLWNLAAYPGSPVPASMPNVLLVSGFDANSLAAVEAWRRPAAHRRLSRPNTVLDEIRTF